MNDEIRDKALENEAVNISPGIPVQFAETPTITGNEQERSNELNDKRGRLIVASCGSHCNTLSDCPPCSRNFSTHGQVDVSLSRGPPSK